MTFLGSLYLHAQTTAIPDSNFEQALINLGIDSDGTVNGQVLSSDIAGVQQLIISDMDIQDMTGIESFINLHYLKLHNIPVSNLNLNANVLLDSLFLYNTNLQSLNLSSNTQLTKLDLYFNYNLTALDLSYNQQLLSLTLSENVNLGNMDFSQNTNLEYLFYDNTFNYVASYINVSNNVNLKNLTFTGFPITSIDLSNNSLLEELKCYNNNLNSLDVSNNPELIKLHCGDENIDFGYFNHIQNLDLSNNPNLIQVKCNHIFLENINLTNCTQLEYLDCSINPLNSLEINNNTLLKTLIAYNANLYNIDLTTNTQLEYLYVENTIGLFGIPLDYKNQLINMDITQNTELILLHCQDNLLESLNLKNGHNDNLIEMFATNNPNLSCIQVDDVSYAENNQHWHKDPGAVYSTDCSSQEIAEYVSAAIEIYPNPAIDRLFIENYSTQEIKQIQIFDISGKQVLQMEFTGDYIDIQALQKDVYVLKIQAGEQWITRKLMKE